MFEWARKIIYNKAQSIADKLRTSEETTEADKTRMARTMSQFSKAPDVLKGESPWKIVTNSVGSNSVFVYNYRNGKWEDIGACSDKVLGVHEYEMRRVMTEKFGAYSLNKDYDRYVGFETVEAAQAFVDDVKGYYDEYHMPRAMMDRMMLYDEGGYPPYFKTHKRCPDEETVTQEREKRLQEQMNRLQMQMR